MLSVRMVQVSAEGVVEAETCPDAAEVSLATEAGPGAGCDEGEEGAAAEAGRDAGCDGKGWAKAEGQDKRMIKIQGMGTRILFIICGNINADFQSFGANLHIIYCLSCNV